MATSKAAKRILTIDDEQSIVDLIVDILEANNYIAVSATKWTDAVDALNHEKPDLILLDLKMPTIHGTSMLDFIVSEGFDIPVVVVSGFVTEKVSQELRSQGVKGIVRKPFKSRELLDEIQKHLPVEASRDAAKGQSMDALYGTAAGPPTPRAPGNSMDALYGTSAIPANPKAPTLSMDALYGTPESAESKTAPAKDILEALKRNAAKAPPISANVPPTPSDMTGAIDPPVVDRDRSAATGPMETSLSPPNPTSAAHIPGTEPPSVRRPIDSPISVFPLAPPHIAPQVAPSFGRREEHHNPRRARKKMDRGNMMFFGAITVVCVLVAGFLAVMQWVASEAPVAMEQFKADIEQGVNSQMNDQMLKMQKQMQKQQIQPQH
ncbi:MAG: response regulator [bacterium]|nr:response regulator [bacterium]